MLGFANVCFVVVVVSVASLVVAAVRAASLRSGAPPERARRVTLVAASALSLWLALLAVGAASGVLTNFHALPPRMFFVLGGGVGLAALATGARWFAPWLDAAPRAWPIAIQTMRVPIEIGLFALYAAGRVPAHLTFEGRNFDVVVGITAPLVAVALRRGWIGARVVLAWNALSLLLLANIVGMAITTMPGPLHLAWPGTDNEIIATWPFVWLPGFLVPVALFGHVLSLRQLAADRRRGRPAVQAATRSAKMAG